MGACAYNGQHRPKKEFRDIMKFNMDIKTAMALGGLLFAFAGFYYTTTSDINAAFLNIQALKSENAMQQRRLDTMDKKMSKVQKQLRALKK